MGTVVELSTLRAMILEILSKNISLKKDIFDALVNENPHLIEEFSLKKQDFGESINIDSEGPYSPILESSDFSKRVNTNSEDPHFPVLEGLTAERKQWLNERIDKDFSKYHDVFKALA